MKWTNSRIQRHPIETERFQNMNVLKNKTAISAIMLTHVLSNLLVLQSFAVFLREVRLLFQILSYVLLQLRAVYGIYAR